LLQIFDNVPSRSNLHYSPATTTIRGGFVFAKYRVNHGGRTIRGCTEIRLVHSQPCNGITAQGACEIICARVRVNWQPNSLRGNVLRAQQTVTQTQGYTNYSGLPAKSTILQLHKSLQSVCTCSVLHGDVVWQRVCFEDNSSSRRRSTQGTEC